MYIFFATLCKLYVLHLLTIFFSGIEKEYKCNLTGFFYGRGTILNFDWFSVTVAWFYGYKATLQEVARILEN